MVRTALSKYADIAPRERRFVVNDYGKPSIAVPQVATGGLEFDISHIDGLALLGVTHERALGVDVENRRAQRADIELVERYLAAEEVAAFRALPSERQQQRCFAYWTLKELYIKVRGMRLSISLQEFRFQLAPDRSIRLKISPCLCDTPADGNSGSSRRAATILSRPARNGQLPRRPC